MSTISMSGTGLVPVHECHTAFRWKRSETSKVTKHEQLLPAYKRLNNKLSLPVLSLNMYFLNKITTQDIHYHVISDVYPLCYFSVCFKVLCFYSFAADKRGFAASLIFD